MAQRIGSQSTKSGRLGGSAATAIVAGDIALGAGWGTTPILAILANSTDQAGELTITCDATAAQATATIALTFTDGAYPNVPVCLPVVHSDSAITDTGHIRVKTLTTTVLTLTLDVLPVDAKIYLVRYLVVEL